MIRLSCRKAEFSIDYWSHSCQVGEYTNKKNIITQEAGLVSRANQSTNNRLRSIIESFYLVINRLKIDYNDQIILWHISFALTDRVGWVDGVCVNV